MQATTRRWAALFPEMDAQDAVDELLAHVSGQRLDDFARRLEREPRMAATDRGLGDRTDAWAPRSPEDPPFAALVWSLASPSVGVLVDRLDALGHVDVDRVLGETVSALQRSLCDRALRTMIAELHDAGADGGLHGDTPEARFRSFTAHTGSEGYRSELARKYPVLVDALQAHARARLSYVGEIAERTLTRRSDLESVLSDARRRSFDRITSVQVGAGDTHQGGRSVATIGFESGATLIYKPRCLAVDVAFARVIAFLNERLGVDLRVANVLTAANHGWAQPIDVAPLAEEVSEAYYRDIGRLTALLLLINGRDMHHENVICDGRSPVPIDLETLLHPTIPERDEVALTAMDRARRLLQESVTSIGLLPTVIASGHRGSDGLDIGATGYRPGTRSPFRSLVLRNVGRDDMHLAFEQQRLRGVPTTPTITSSAEDLIRVRTAVTGGFRELYEWVLTHRAEFAAVVAGAFADVPVRFVAAPTRFYSQLLTMASHRDFQREPVSRLVLLHRVALRPGDQDPTITRAEIADLAAGDIPYFAARTSSRWICDSSARPIVECLDRTPLEAALDRIGSASEDDLALQTRLIGISFVNKLDREADRTGFTLPVAGVAPPASDRDLLECATEMGDVLLATETRSDRADAPSTWIGPHVSTVESHMWAPGYASYDLYGGIAGIGLFLAQLARVGGAWRHAAAARRVLEPLADQLTASGLLGKPVSVGAFTGVAGLLYSLLHGGLALDDHHLVQTALDRVDLIGELVGDDTTFDVIGGAAGALGVALTLGRHARTHEQRTAALAAAQACHRHLASGHPCLRDGERLDAVVHGGFAHGVAGTVPYLLQLAAASGDDRPLDDADRLFAIDLSLYDESARDWYTSTQRDERSYGWCHGAPGLALSRLLALTSGAPGAERYGAHLASALDVLVRAGFGSNATWCHGDLGALAIAALAGRVLGDIQLVQRARSGYRRLHHDVLRGFTSAPSGRYAYSTSLLIGYPGVGYSALRGLCPDEVPSFLWLE
jgi:type 2 lantibiotic biosynthesis protein LanM